MDDDLKIQRALLRIFFYSVMGNVCNVGYDLSLHKLLGSLVRNRNGSVRKGRGRRKSFGCTSPGWGCRTRRRVDSGTVPHRTAPGTL